MARVRLYSAVPIGEKMQQFSHTALGVCQGSTLLFSDFEDNGPMWTGEGPRMSRHPVRFDQPFLMPPIVHLSVSMWDIDGGANQRADLSAQKVTVEGFEILFRTWGDTRVARIRADWLALGAVQNEDDFHL